VLRGIQAPHEDFVAWFTSATWLSRVCTRVFLLQHGDEGRREGDVAGAVSRVVAAGVVPQALRLQVCPRKSEIAVGVRVNTTYLRRLCHELASAVALQPTNAIEYATNFNVMMPAASR
jgi:hypothetical protein